jgi:hypothetical protein
MSNAGVFQYGILRARGDSVSSHRLTLPIGVFVALGICTVIACANNDVEEDDTQFRQDVIWCEEAASHLEECCGGKFDPHQVECRHYYRKDTGCDQTTITKTDPAFTTDEASCLRKASCQTILANGICARALAAGQARSVNYSVSNGVGGSSSSGTSSSTGGSAAPDAGPVCP